MTNGLSVRQEQGCGCLFYCAKKNRLCLSSYSIQRERVSPAVSAVFVFTERVLVLSKGGGGGYQKVLLLHVLPLRMR